MTPVAQEQSQVQWGTTLISYRIRRSSRKKTVAVTVAPPGEVILTAPRGIAIERLDRIVHAKAPWIAAKVRKVKQALPPASTREFVSGESYLYLGRHYRLEVVRGGPGGVRLERGRLRVGAPELLSGDGSRAALRDALRRWYRDHAAVRLTERARWWAQRLGVPEPKVLIREQERRWGSCAAGTLRFNWRIIQAPMRLLDYVVAHEITHLLHEHHGRGFWSALGTLLPDYDRRRADLRNLGALLTW